ncbi:substrate-binding periplasmic protein [Bacterioplanes sanyensis]|nr:transporter substrate-binding domain-containing protein [Bacterioplanes sanyensis]
MRLVVAAVVWLLASAALADTVTLAIGDWEPFTSSKDPEGKISQNIVQEAFATQGMTVDFKFMPWKRAYENAKAGNVDGTFPWYSNEERAQEMMIAEKALLQENEVFFYRADTNFDWASFADLKQYKLGGSIGYSHVDILEGEGVELDKAKDDLTNLKKLAAGRIDAFPIGLNVGKYLVKNNLPADQAAMIKQHPKALSSGDMFMLFVKNDRGRQLADVFNKGIQALKDSGRYDELLK